MIKYLGSDRAFFDAVMFFAVLSYLSDAAKAMVAGDWIMSALGFVCFSMLPFAWRRWRRKI